MASLAHDWPAAACFELLGAATRIRGMVVKSLAAVLAVAGLAWGVGQASHSSATPQQSSVSAKRPGVECVTGQSGRDCGIGVAIENDELAISPDGKNGYLIIRFFGPDLERGGVYTYDRNPTTGSLVQKQGTAGCIAQGRRKGCVGGRALRDGSDIVASPDGRNVYAATEDAIAIFDRDPTTGELTQPAGAAGCITSKRNKKNPTCAQARGLFSGGIATSPDGMNVYVGGDSLAVFDRDPTTGALTQKPGSGGAKRAAGDVIVSPDGKNVYAVTFEPDGIETFDRDPATGALARIPGRAGCVSEKRQGGCRRGRELIVFGLSISPDGRSVYGAGSRGPGQGDYGVVTILDRLPDGTLAQKKGRAGCFAMFGGEGDGCARTESISEATDSTVSADGKRVYVFSYFATSAEIFIRHPSGRLTERPGD